MWIPFLLFSYSESFIRNLDKPPCIQCQYYRPEVSTSFSSSEGKCTKYGGKDLHTGVVVYDYATSVRTDESKCSTAGTFFIGEKKQFIKKMLHCLTHGSHEITLYLMRIKEFIYN